MVAPADVRMFTVAAYGRQCLADDVDHFFAQLAPDPAATLDACIRAASVSPSGRSSSPDARLREIGLRCEERYLAWRARNRHASLAASMLTYDCLAGQIEELVPRIAVGLVGAGHRALTEAALRRAERDLGYLSALAMIKRAAMRCWYDSDGYDRARVEEMCRISNDAFVEEPMFDKAGLDGMRRALGNAVRYGVPEGWDRRTARAYMRGNADRERRVLKRSVRAAERFAGAEATRLFVSGEAVRITGRLATYELRRNGHLMQDHGGAVLSVYTREGDVFLCHLCIYTAGVPLLDHVASIFLHIRAGDEESLLETGNAFDVAPAAADQPWLAPYLAKTPAPVAAIREGRDLPTRRLVRDLSVHLFDELGRYCPGMPETRSLLGNGCTQADVVYVPIGTEVEGMVRVGQHDLGFPGLVAA